jgi:hypothetical protein
MLAIVFQVLQVIKEINTAGSAAESHKRQGCPLKEERVEQSLRKDKAHEKRQVLRPLAGTHRQEQGRDATAHAYGPGLKDKDFRRGWEVICAIHEFCLFFPSVS